jgi:photosystem I subunit II
MFRDKFMAETLTGQTPFFLGSTGGLLTKADREEKYAITWTSPKQQVFEMPTGGSATMREGDNLLYMARKEQCIALGAQFRSKFKPRIENYKIYRVFPSGETQYLHPKDGVFPEKVNQGRPRVGSNERNIGSNPEPATIKFSGRKTFDP